jgi:hypothetical protein
MPVVLPDQRTSASELGDGRNLLHLRLVPARRRPLSSSRRGADAGVVARCVRGGRKKLYAVTELEGWLDREAESAR